MIEGEENGFWSEWIGEFEHQEQKEQTVEV